MIKRVLLLIVLLYFLTLLQASFLVHFSIAGFTVNAVLILVLLWNILESSKKNWGIYIALIGGLFLDIFSGHFIGLNILILLIASIFIKYILKRYVRTPFFEKV